MTHATASEQSERSGNPAFSEHSFGQYVADSSSVGTMTIGGVAAKTMLNLVFLVAAAAWGWSSATESVGTDIGTGYGNTTVTLPGGFWLASFGALLVGIVIAMNPRKAALLGFLYALLEGYVLGAISAAFDAQTEGIVGAAILGTVCVFLVSLILYATRIIKPTRKMAFGVTAAMGGLCLLYFAVFVVSIFNWDWLYSESFRTIGLVITVLSIVLAALSFTLDFASIERGVASGAPKFMEWYSAYGLMLTLIWLYLEMLRLLALLARNR